VRVPPSVLLTPPAVPLLLDTRDTSTRCGCRRPARESGRACRSEGTASRPAGTPAGLDRPERLGHPHVPNPGDEPLIPERLAEPAVARAPQPRHDRVDVELLGEHVLTQPADAPGLERQYRPVPEHALELIAAEDEPRQSCARLAARLDLPAAGHAQVAADDDAALEPEQQILADRVHRLEHAAVHAGGDAGRLCARVRGLDLEPLPNERLNRRAAR